MVTIAAMQRALVDLDYCRIGSFDERATAYVCAGFSEPLISKFDARAWESERIRRGLFPARLRECAA
jgi:hypothetical protein